MNRFTAVLTALILAVASSATSASNALYPSLRLTKECSEWCTQPGDPGNTILDIKVLGTYIAPLNQGPAFVYSPGYVSIYGCSERTLTNPGASPNCYLIWAHPGEWYDLDDLAAYTFVQNYTGAARWITVAATPSNFPASEREQYAVTITDQDAGPRLFCNVNTGGGVNDW